jgi:mannose-6-phosphate isomerase-like protein (cupin superfamily)
LPAGATNRARRLSTHHWKVPTMTDLLPRAPAEPPTDPVHPAADLEPVVAGTGPWVSVLLTLALGALVVFAIVALVVPSRLTDPSRMAGKVLMGATFEGPVDMHVSGHPNMEIARLVLPPGKTMDWHVHRGYVLTSVASGVATFYDGNDPQCRPHRVGPGRAVVDPPHFPHTVRNEGSVPLVLYNVGVTVQGQASVKDVPADPACHFADPGHEHSEEH